MRLSEEQEASASQVVRNWEDKKNMMRISGLALLSWRNNWWGTQLLHSLGRSLSDAECVLKISIQTTTNPLEFLSPQLF